MNDTHSAKRAHDQADSADGQSRVTATDPVATLGTDRMVAVMPDDDGQRLDRWLGKRCPHLSYVQIQKLIRKGQVRVDGKRSAADARLQTGQRVRLPLGAEGDPALASRALTSPYDERDIRSMIVYEEPSFFLLNKPKGLATQGGSGVVRHLDSMLEALTRHDVKPRLVHRLDRDTSGLMIIARSASIARVFGRMLEHKQIDKTYRAIVRGQPPEPLGMIDAPLTKATGDNREKVIIHPRNGQNAQTRYRLVASGDQDTALMEFYPLTGRTHQIRVHAAHIGCPLWGDCKYNPDDSAADSFFLHAMRLVFTHPETDRPFSFKIDPPDEFQQLMKHLNLNA